MVKLWLFCAVGMPVASSVPGCAAIGGAVNGARFADAGLRADDEGLAGSVGRGDGQRRNHGRCGQRRPGYAAVAGFLQAAGGCPGEQGLIDGEIG